MQWNECPECGVRPGQYHQRGCEIEACPYCGDQMAGCPCPESPPLDDRMIWTGVFPGADECVEFGWYARLVRGRGWVACGPDDPGAEPDLYRLHEEACWDRLNKRFVLHQPVPLSSSWAHDEMD